MLIYKINTAWSHLHRSLGHNLKPLVNLSKQSPITCTQLVAIES